MSERLDPELLWLVNPLQWETPRQVLFRNEIKVFQVYYKNYKCVEI